MKILVFSDSHKYNTGMERIIRTYRKNTDCVLHLGDCCCDALLMSYMFPEIRFEWVRGNCDNSSDPTEKLLVLGGKKIFITHGHIYHVKSSHQRIVYTALENKADACFFGHSHLSTNFYENGILFMNPGSISFPREAPLPTYGVVHISDDVLEGCITSVNTE